MKSIYRSSVFLMLFLLLALNSSCKKEKAETKAQYSIEPKTISVNWTGYKTTEKVAVTGQFQEIRISNLKMADTALEAINGTEFEIPVSSLFSDNEVRDSKLKELFFGVMDATVNLSGTLNLNNDGTGFIDLKMNAVQKELPITYIISGQLVEIEGVINLDDWQAQKAWESIHQACFDLHKGADGESKTWKDVAVKAAIYLKKK